MILYQKKDDIRLESFGIQIPFRYHRPAQILEYLKNSPSYQDHWQGYVRQIRPEELKDSQLIRAHSIDFIDRIRGDEAAEEIIKCYELRDGKGDWHRYDPSQAEIPLSKLAHLQILEASATLQCAYQALESGFCYHLGGGQHHAMADVGRGFCLVNDIVISSLELLSKDLVKQIWVIDIDAHKGDGTAALTEKTPSITTLSVHMKDSWPVCDYPGRDPRVDISSDIEIEMSKGEDEHYLPRLDEGLKRLKSDFPHPGLAIVVNGSDPSARDVLPSTESMQLSDEQMFRRDQIVYELLSDLRVPQLWLLAGGYGDEVYRIHGKFLEYWLLNNAAN